MIRNIAAYHFVPVDQPQALCDQLLSRAEALALRGTILVAGEGINLFLAGEADAVRGFVAELRADARFGALETKESWSAAQPFRRLLVKVKREIIRMDHPAIKPAAEERRESRCSMGWWQPCSDVRSGSKWRRASWMVGRLEARRGRGGFA